MRSVLAYAVAALLWFAPPAAPAPPRGGKPAHLAEKTAALAVVERQSGELSALSDAVWHFAETALREVQSAKALADWAEAHGFRVTRGVAGLPTSFVASYGEGSPVVGVLGEYDALPGLSQKAQPTQEALSPGSPGHGCGHNLLGVASLGAAAAVKELLATDRLKGTVKVFGTPAEETVGGKIYMLREGVMDGVDVMLAWHPSDETESDTSGSQAMVDLLVEFHGRSAHAAYDPWNGRSAADAAEIFTFAVNRMREHLRPTSRVHYTVLEAGKVPNVIADYAKVWIWLRDADRREVEGMQARVRDIARAAALAAGVTSSVTLQAGNWNTLGNLTGQRLLHRNLLWLGPLQFSEEEQAFARRIQEATGVEPRGLLPDVQPLVEEPGPPEGGSTDAGDVSWVIPTIHLNVTTAPVGAPWHSWGVVACSGMSIGHKGMLYAAKALAATMVDLLAEPATVTSIREEFASRRGDVTWVPFVPPGPPPLPESP